MIDALKKISSPSIANGIETFKVRPRNVGQMSSEIKCLFPELGPLVRPQRPLPHEPLAPHLPAEPAPPALLGHLGQRRRHPPHVLPRGHPATLGVVPREVVNGVA